MYLSTLMNGTSAGHQLGQLALEYMHESLTFIKETTYVYVGDLIIKMRPGRELGRISFGLGC